MAGACPLHRVPPTPAGQRRTGVAAHRGVLRVHRRHATCRRDLPRDGPVRHHGFERRLPVGLLQHGAGHLPDRTGRDGVRHQSRRRGVRRPGGERIPRLELEHGLGSAHEDPRQGMERGVRDPLPVAALRQGRGAQLGRQLRTDHSAQQRGLLLGTGASPVQHVPLVARGRHRRHQSTAPAGAISRSRPMRSVE